MPVVFNEPLSFLQRLSENIEYCNLLDKANNADDPVQRMEVSFHAIVFYALYLIKLQFSISLFYYV